MATRTKSKLLRCMVDANVLIAGMGWPRFPYEVLRHATHRDFQLVLSPLVIEEARRNVARLFPDKREALETFFTASHYETAKNPSRAIVKKYSRLVRDADDIPHALSAIQAKVILITQDKDLTAQDKSTEELRKLLNILLPGTFLRKYMGWTSDQLEAIRQRNWKDFS